jgi:hypothetical protein
VIFFKVSVNPDKLDVQATTGALKCPPQVGMEAGIVLLKLDLCGWA